MHCRAAIVVVAVVAFALGCGMNAGQGPQPPSDPLYKGPTPTTTFVAKSEDGGAPRPPITPFQGTTTVPLFKR